MAGVDPAETDLPAALREKIRKVDAGATVSIALGAAGTLTVDVLAADSEPAAGYLPVLYALRHGTEKQGDLAALDSLNEPYQRPHEDDTAFYAAPRLVSHLDETAQGAWREFTGRFVGAGAAVLDLMASCDSHFSPHLQPGYVIGLGMNGAELAHNTHLGGRIIHDLNRAPRLPLATASFDVALCALSIEYLNRPEAVLAEVRRCLKRDGRCVVSFSERWFPPKAVTPWPTLPPFARVAWVARHLQRAGFVDLHTESLRGLPRPTDDKYFRQTRLADPLYAVWGRAP